MPTPKPFHAHAQLRPLTSVNVSLQVTVQLEDVDVEEHLRAIINVSGTPDLLKKGRPVVYVLYFRERRVIVNLLPCESEKPTESKTLPTGFKKPKPKAVVTAKDYLEDAAGAGEILPACHSCTLIPLTQGSLRCTCPWTCTCTAQHNITWTLDMYMLHVHVHVRRPLCVRSALEVLRPAFARSHGKHAAALQAEYVRDPQYLLAAEHLHWWSGRQHNCPLRRRYESHNVLEEARPPFAGWTRCLSADLGLCASELA